MARRLKGRAASAGRNRRLQSSLALVAAAIVVYPLAASAIAGRQPAAREVARAAVASMPACATRNLVMWLDTNGEASAGSVHYELELTNLSRHTCVLRGYPGVSAVKLTGRPLGAPAARDAHTAVRTIVLASGRSASAALQITDTDVFDSTVCRSITAAGLRVFPPNRTTSKVVPFPFRACSRPGPTYLRVQTVTTATPR
jgi:hypothetical protein